MFSGLIALPGWGYVLVALILTHITIAAVTIFLHRHQAHRALELHPAVSWFFRFWLWLTTGTVTREWVAVHRKHHVKVETPEDPHSPQVYGLNRVLFGGYGLYLTATRDQETLRKYGDGTPDDWFERNIFGKRTWLGLGLMGMIDVGLFGIIAGTVIFLVQLVWIPFWAGGVINGVGHYFGYRNYDVDDASTNIVPLGILVGGEELHNNHHGYASSAKLSNRWYEFDLGWFYIRLLAAFQLAEVRKIAPKLRLKLSKTQCDLETVHAVFAHRYEVMAKYAHSVKLLYAQEIRRAKEKANLSAERLKAFKAGRRWLNRDANRLGDREKAILNEVLTESKVLSTVYSMRQELVALWQRPNATKEQLVKQLENWCARAEASGIIQLAEFSKRLRCYT